MTQVRRVLCVSGDQDVVDRVRAVLADAVPDAEVAASDGGVVGSAPRFSVAVITDVAVENPREVVADLHTEAPGLPILVAARNGDGAFVSDALVAGAADYVPLDDDERLRDRLERLLDANSGLDRFFNHLVENVGVGVGAYGRDGVMNYMNPAYADLVGRTPTELRGLHVWDVNPTVDPDAFQQYFDSFSPGETRHADTEHVRADGTVIPVHTVTTCVMMGGTPTHVGTIMDITERVETQQKIEALHEVANELAEPDTVEGVHELVVEAADRILDMHSCYYIDHREETFYITTCSENGYYDMQEFPHEYGVIWETYRTGEGMLVEDAQNHPIAEPTSDKFRSAVSVPVGDHGVFQAVSTEAGAFDEEDLELADLLATHAAAALDRVHFASAIRNERDRLAALFRNVPNPVIEYELDADDTPIATDVNPAFEEVFGFAVDEFIGSSIDESIVPPGDLDRARSFNQDLIAGESITAEVRRLTANGARDFLLDVVPVESNDERDTGYAIYTDITDQKQRERLLERQNDRLEEFASVVSHDLRNPLNVATGRLDLATQTADEDTAEHVSHASEALDRMDALIADLLSLAREGRSLGETEQADLEVVAREAWSSVETADATLVTEDAPTIRADEDRVRQLFENLFRNSVEHGGTDVTVTVESTPGGFAVCDDGPGIPEDVRDRVFTSGFTTSDAGTGFGLSIVERIAGAHGWTVDLAANEGGGTRFVFNVPDVD